MNTNYIMDYFKMKEKNKLWKLHFCMQATWWVFMHIICIHKLKLKKNVLKLENCSVIDMYGIFIIIPVKNVLLFFHVSYEMLRKNKHYIVIVVIKLS